MRNVLVGVLWAILLFVGIEFSLGFMIGMFASDPENAKTIAQEAGAHLGLPILMGSIGVAAWGARSGWLLGARPKAG